MASFIIATLAVSPSVIDYPADDVPTIYHRCDAKTQPGPNWKTPESLVKDAPEHDDKLEQTTRLHRR